MVAQAEDILDSVELSAAGRDYPEGEVIQPPRHDRWYQMDAYKRHFAEFVKLKPDFDDKQRDEE